MKITIPGEGETLTRAKAAEMMDELEGLTESGELLIEEIRLIPREEIPEEAEIQGKRGVSDTDSSEHPSGESIPRSEWPDVHGISTQSLPVGSTTRQVIETLAEHHSEAPLRQDEIANRLPPDANANVQQTCHRFVEDGLIDRETIPNENPGRNPYGHWLSETGREFAHRELGISVDPPESEQSPESEPEPVEDTDSEGDAPDSPEDTDSETETETDPEDPGSIIEEINLSPESRRYHLLALLDAEDDGMAPLTVEQIHSLLEDTEWERPSTSLNRDLGSLYADCLTEREERETEGGGRNPFAYRISEEGRAVVAQTQTKDRAKTWPEVATDSIISEDSEDSEEGEPADSEDEPEIEPEPVEDTDSEGDAPDTPEDTDSETETDSEESESQTHGQTVAGLDALMGEGEDLSADPEPGLSYESLRSQTGGEEE